MANVINTEFFIEAWGGERCLWKVSSVIYKKCYEKAYLCLFWLYHLEQFPKLHQSTVVSRTLIHLQTLILALASHRSLN